MASSQSSIDFAILSLDNLGNQISQFVSSTSNGDEFVKGFELVNQEALKDSLLRMRVLLMDAQTQFSDMAENKKQLATKIDGSISSVSAEVDVVKAELRRLSSITTEHESKNCSDEEKKSLKEENLKLRNELRELHTEIESWRDVGQRITDNRDITSSFNQLKLEIIQLKQELIQSKETIQALKANQKTLKAEKLDLLGQMRQLYGTLEDKEAELGNFIQNFEKRIQESNETVLKLAAEKEDFEKLKYDMQKRMEALSRHNSDMRAELERKEQIIEQMEKHIGNPHMTRDHSWTYSSESEMSGFKNSVSDGSIMLSTQSITPNSPAQLDDEVKSCHADYVNCQTFPRSAVRSDNHNKATQKVSWSVDNQIGQSVTCIENGKTSHNTSQNSLNAEKNRVNSLEHVQHQVPCRARSMSMQLCDDDKMKSLCNAKGLSVGRWKASHVQAWLEMELNMIMYSRACMENIKSGKVLMTMSDSELDSALGLQSAMHRRKLRLAIEELCHPNAIQYPLAPTLDHKWIANDWIPSLGLPQFSTVFEAQLVDGRLLNSLTAKDLERHFTMQNKTHQGSVLSAVQLLRHLGFDKEVLQERRQRSLKEVKDPLVWTNDQVIDWIQSIDLQEYGPNLKNSGVHGALLVLDHSFTVEFLASELGIVSNKSYIIRHLATELEAIVVPARNALSHSTPPVKKTSISRSPFVRPAKLGNKSKDEIENATKSPRSSFSFRGSIGRAFGRKIRKEIILVQNHEPANISNGLANIVESSNGGDETKSSNDVKDRLI